MDSFEIILLICFVIGLIIIIILAFQSPKGTHISYGHEPYPNCEDCHGTGIVEVEITSGDEMECPCTIRIRDC